MINSVCVNGRFLNRQVTGVERYAGEVLKRFENRIRKIVPFKRLTGWSGHLWEQITLPRLVGSNEMLWSPANTGPLLMKNQVVTVHDLSVIEHPEWFRWDFSIWYNYFLPRVLNNASRVITISNFSKQRMIDYLNIPEHKIIVAPGGVDTSIFFPTNSENIAEICRKYEIKQPYLLVMDPGNPRKNAITLLKAWDVLKDEHPKFSLVLIGRDYGLVERAEATFSSKRIKYIHYLPDRDLAGLMSGASVFVHISMYEGFGLSVLEAMACGTPVIAANTGGLKESVGDCGYLLAPLDVDGLLHGIDLIITDSEFRNELLSSGFNRASQFGWESTADIVATALWNP